MTNSHKNSMLSYLGYKTEEFDPSLHRPFLAVIIFKPLGNGAFDNYQCASMKAAQEIMDKEPDVKWIVNDNTKWGFK